MTIKRTTKARIAAIAAAAVAAFSVAPGAASAEAATINADVSLWMQYQPRGLGVAKGFLFGGVSAEHKACLNTEIRFSRMKGYDHNTWDYNWAYRNVTRSDPGFTVYLENSDRGHQYTINTPKQVIRKNGNKIICDYGSQYDYVDAT